MTTNTQWQRLYAPAGDGSGAIRGAVLELARPADWSALAALWRGVQAEFGWPAPAIAVNGRDGYQLWFSFAAPLPAAEALALLADLRGRFLPELRDERLTLAAVRDASEMPPRQTGDEQWSAFVAPDLAPVFAETPWLDIEPNVEGQGELLARLASIGPAALASVAAAPAAAPAPSPAPVRATEPPDQQDPRAFLLRVMNDDAVPLPLRIEAAKALLAHPAAQA